MSRFDHYIGLVTAELEKQGVLENTLIVIAADNGRPFPRDKARLYDSGIKTLWVVYYPKIIKNPSVSNSLISSIDFSATCLELAEIQKPECIQGQSFVPILKKPEASVREVVFSEQNWHVYKNHSHMVRFENFVYIKNNYPNQPNLSSASDDSFPAGRELWEAYADNTATAIQQQVFANPCPSEEFYDVNKDPNQLRNLANNPEYAEIIKKARIQLSKWTEETGDTIPENPSESIHAFPRIEDGVIFSIEKAAGIQKPTGEMAGAAKNAEKINHPGPIRLTESE